MEIKIFLTLIAFAFLFLKMYSFVKSHLADIPRWLFHALTTV